MTRRRSQLLLNEEVGLQIAPMIDVTMLLLFFFMLSTTLAHRRDADRIELPVGKSEEDRQPNEDPLVILLSGSGRIVLNGTLTSFEKLGSDISSRSRSAATRNRIVEINADSATPGATIKRLVAAISDAGIPEISYVIRQQ